MKKQFFSLALFAAAWLAGGTALAHDGDHSYNAKGICTIDGCTDKYQPATFNEENDEKWYELRNAGNIEWMSKVIQENGKGTDNVAYATSKFKMMNDIDFTGVTHTKIGQTEGLKFDGTFDGQGFRITNLVMNEPSNTRIGFFGYCRGEFTVIRNIIIDKTCSFKGKECVAALIGTFQKAVTNKYPTIENCVNEANVTATDKSAAAFVGGKPSNDDMPRLFITNCINTGDIKVEASVSGNDCAAAIVANYNCGSGKGGNSTLTNCVNTGTVSPANGDQTLFTGSYRSYVNCYNVKTGKMNNSSTAIEWSTANPIGNGELCYKLNGSTDAGTAYYQTIGTDEYPLPFSSHQQVRQANANNFTNLTVSEGTVQLGSAANLIKFSQEVNAGNTTMNAAMTSDIDVSTGGYEPIGTDTKKYAGTFDGGGHKVNLNIDANAYGQGFIGVGQGGLTVRNLIVTGKVKNAGSKTGGIVAEVHGGTGTVTIANCGNEAKIEGAGGETAAIVANNWGGTCTLNITNVYNIGDVSGSVDVASICACQANGSSVFTNVYNSGTVTGDAGGKFVRTSYGTYTRCYSTSLSASDNASIIETNSTEITSGKLCYLLNDDQSSIVWYQKLDEDDHPKPFSKDGARVYCVDITYCDGSFQESSAGYNNSTSSVMGDHKYNPANGLCYCSNLPDETWKSASDDGYYHFTTPEEVEWFSHMVRDAKHSAMNVKLDADIDYNNVKNAHLPIGIYTQKYWGKFDGQGHTIKNMVLENCENNDNGLGFFGCIRVGGAGNSSTEIKNLTVEGSITNDKNNTAGIVGRISEYNEGATVLIENCINKATINTTRDYAAGIVGQLNNTPGVTVTVRKCINEGTVTITGLCAAGIVSQVNDCAVNLNIESCLNLAEIKSTGNKNCGGIFGANTRSKAIVHIINCGNTGNVTGTEESATITGWIGSNSGQVITNCWNSGSLTGIKGTQEMYRDQDSSVTPSNLFTTQSEGNQGTKITSSQVSSGELCYLLNGSSSYNPVWTQTIGTDSYPMPFNTQGIVNKISAAGYTTQYIPSTDVTIPTGVEAYAGVINGSAIRLVAIEDAISKNDAVVLKGSEGYYSFVPITGISEAAANDLKGSDGTIAGGTNIYALSQKSGAVGFYPVAATVTIPAGKAYLEYTASDPSSPVKGFTFVFDEDDATGISLMEDGRSQMEDGAIYNIAGQRINKMQRGINIVNGKKIAVK